MQQVPLTVPQFAAHSDFRAMSRRRLLGMGAGVLGLSLSDVLALRSRAASSAVERPGFGRAKSCIVLFCWGGMSHLDIWDPKPEAPAGMRGPFQPISTATPGIQFGEHVPVLAKQTERLAIIRSLHHRSAAHGRSMYWSLTGHASPRPESAENLPPSRHDWPSLTAMVGHFRQAPKGIPRSIRLPCPMSTPTHCKPENRADGWVFRRTRSSSTPPKEDRSVAGSEIWGQRCSISGEASTGLVSENECGCSPWKDRSNVRRLSSHSGFIGSWRPICC